MLRLDRKARSSMRLSAIPLSQAGVLERIDLQKVICNSPDQFFAELGEQLLQIGEEVRPSDAVDDRIDVLAIDSEAAVVIIELKRGAHKLQLLQSLAYSAMISDWVPEELIDERAKFTNKTLDEASEEIEDFLSEESTSLNASQRIILIAEEYEYEVLVTAKWLSEKHDVDISCWKLELAADGSAEYLSLACIYPPAELADAARSRRKFTRRPSRWKNWEEVFAHIGNPAVVAFYKTRLSENWPSRLGRRRLDFQVEGRGRLVMYARQGHAYVFQKARFEGDEPFWRERLGPSCKLDPLRRGRALRFIPLTWEDYCNVIILHFASRRFEGVPCHWVIIGFRSKRRFRLCFWVC